MYIAGQYIMFCANARYCQLQYGCILQLRCTFSWSGSIKQSRVHSYLNQKRIMHPKALTQRFFINIKCYLSALSLLVASPSDFSRVFLRKATRTRLFSRVLAVLAVCVSQQRRFHSITIIISSYGLQAPACFVYDSFLVTTTAFITAHILTCLVYNLNKRSYSKGRCVWTVERNGALCCGFGPAVGASVAGQQWKKERQWW